MVSSFSTFDIRQPRGGCNMTKIPERGVRSEMQALEPLDLSRCESVSDIVAGMSRCSFGARMLGEAAETMTAWAGEPSKPTVVYDGRRDSAVARLLTSMVDRGFCRDLVTPDEFVSGKDMPHGGNTLVVGAYPERIADEFHAKAGRTLFINQYGMARPGQVRDGHFPDVVFSDERFVMPILARTIEERRGGRRLMIGGLAIELESMGGLAHSFLHGTETMSRAIRDPHCTVFMTLSGAMTIAKMGLLMCDMIDRG